MRITAKVALETQGPVSLEAMLAVQDLAEPRIRYVQDNQQGTDTDTHGLDVIFQQDLSGVDGADSVLKHKAGFSKKFQCGSSIRTSKKPRETPLER